MHIKVIKFKIKEIIDRTIKISLSSLVILFEYFGYKLLNIKKNNVKNKIDILNNKYSILKNEYDNTLPENVSDNFKIDNNFILDLAYVTQIMLKKSKISIDHGKILYSLVMKKCEENKKHNLNIVEIGTAKGFSSICMAKALNDSNSNGRIYTFDIVHHNKKYIWNNISDIDQQVSRKKMLSKWHDLISKYIVFISGFSHINLKRIYLGRINFAFIDGSHYGHDILFEFKEISRHQDLGDQVLFDDYNDSRYRSLSNQVDNLCKNLNYKKELLLGKNGRNYLLATKY